MNASDLITVAEAAKALGRCEVTVRRLIKRGQLPAVRVGGTWAIARSAIDTIRILAGATDMRATAPATLRARGRSR